MDRVHRPLDQRLGRLAGRSRGVRRERAPAQAAARGELRVGALGAPVGQLHRPKELLLQHVSGPLVELFVGLAESGERLGDLLGRDGEIAENLLAPF